MFFCLYGVAKLNYQHWSSLSEEFSLVIVIEPRPELVLKMFLNFGQREPRCSCKIQYYQNVCSCVKLKLFTTWTLLTCICMVSKAEIFLVSVE